MDYKAIVRAVALERGYILRNKQEEAILAFLQNQHVFFLSLLAMASHCTTHCFLPYMIS